MFVYLDIVEQFVCGQCGACCGRDWLVTVDEATYRRNAGLFAARGRQAEFRQAFVELADEAEFGEYARISKQAGGACLFLSEERLCRLQQMAGHDHLDTVCQWFPRYPMDTGRGVELSLSFSCPAALRLAMREDPLRIVRADTSPLTAVPTDFVVHVYPGQQPPRSVLRYYFELEGHLIDVLQERRVSLRDRVALVRSLLTSLAEPARDGEAPSEALSRLRRENYAALDALAVAGAATAGPAEWLLENYFVNFIFRKTVYTRGLRDAASSMVALLGRLQPAVSRGADALDWLCGEIVQAELELNHGRRRSVRSSC